MAAKPKLRADDLVRVIQSGGGLGPTLYQVEFVGERGHCVIREAGKPLAGGQVFDTSLLRKVSRDEPLSHSDRRVRDIKAGKIKEGPALLSKLLSF